MLFWVHLFYFRKMEISGSEWPHFGILENFQIIIKYKCL